MRPTWRQLPRPPRSVAPPLHRLAATPRKALPAARTSSRLLAAPSAYGVCCACSSGEGGGREGQHVCTQRTCMHTHTYTLVEAVRETQGTGARRDRGLRCTASRCAVCDCHAQAGSFILSAACGGGGGGGGDGPHRFKISPGTTHQSLQSKLLPSRQQLPDLLQQQQLTATAQPTVRGGRPRPAHAKPRGSSVNDSGGLICVTCCQAAAAAAAAAPWRASCVACCVHPAPSPAQ